MLLTAEQHARIAAALRRAAADPNLRREERDDLLQKAERFEILSARASAIEKAKEEPKLRRLREILHKDSEVVSCGTKEAD